jgi:hypothetical protein
LLSRHGLRTVEGQHATLVTDLPQSAEIDALPRVIDAAVPIWEERFGLPPGAAADWRVQAYLVTDREKLMAARLMPDKSREFQYGLSLGHELWLYDQETDYYRRHLLLHEATHSFMATNLGGCGPGWYMEGMAELLGAHTWDPASGKLEMAVMLPEGPDARALGRVGLLQEAYPAKRALSIPAVMKIDNTRVLANESYAWVWALSKLLDTHPRYQERFRRLPKFVLSTDFNDRLRKACAQDWSDLQTEWRLMIATLQYGHDIPREAIDFKSGEPLTKPVTTTIRADRGWQSTGVLVEAGKPYRIEATGRFTISREPDGSVVPSEAGGVTLDYHAGAPLGMLLASVDDRGDRGASSGRPAGFGPGSFIEPTRLGLAKTFTPQRSGTLYLRVNDSAAELGENEGELRVSIGK